MPSFEWYLKNHLGSTMLVYGTQGISDPNVLNLGSLKAAYDYRAFGEQVDLTILFNDKVTETFTGKEKDDETELSYFGARYLDPMLGVWIAVDAKRQFNSPYLYAGNGANPVNGVDPDGNEIYLASNQQQLLDYINKASYNQYTINENNRLIPSNTCNEKGNKYYSERLDAGIISANTLVLLIKDDPIVSKRGDGLTMMNGEYGLGFAASIVSEKPYGTSSASQNLLHEVVSHGIPFILGDRDPNGSALFEELRATDGVFSPPNVPDHSIYDSEESVDK